VELRGLSQLLQLYTGAQTNFRDLTPYLTNGTYDTHVSSPVLLPIGWWGSFGGGGGGRECF
jgi:hypothetical protein